MSSFVVMTTSISTACSEPTFLGNSIFNGTLQLILIVASIQVYDIVQGIDANKKLLRLFLCRILAWF